MTGDNQSSSSFWLFYSLKSPKERDTFMSTIKLIEGPLYDYAVKEVDTILAKMNTPSQEGLNSNLVGRFFVSLCDTLLGVCTTLTTNFTKITKSIKRSELHEFIGSNRLKVFTVDKIAFSKLVGFMVDVPAGLHGTYKDAIKNIAKLYTRINALNVAKMNSASLIKIYTALTNGDATAANGIREMYKLMDATTKAVGSAITECQNNFNGKFQEKAKFEEVFSTKDEWVECQKLMLDLEPRLQEVRTVRELTEQMEATLKNICTYMTDNPDKLSQQDLTMFGETIKKLALIMDGFNLAVTRHLSLEHNYVIMINSIYAGVTK